MAAKRRSAERAVAGAAAGGRRGRWPLARDAAAPFAPPLSEDVLSHLWSGQRFPQSALVTAAGVPLRVLHPGRRGRGPGPDFRDALVAPRSGRLLRGDVELHLRESDFRAHGHASDARYDGVVLHVVFEEEGAIETRLASGRRVPVLALAPWVRRRAAELAGWLAAPPLWREPCHDALARLGADEAGRVLDGLGEERFAERRAALGAAIGARGAEGALYGALLEALGYGGARAPLAGVAERLPWERLDRALGTAAPGARAPLAERLLIAACGDTAAAATRPANQPERRLAGLARLIARHRPLGAVQAAGGPRELIAGWSAGAPAGGGAALIGRSRAVELLVNAVLPWRAALGERDGDPGAAEEALRAYRALPRPARYGGLAFLEANLDAVRLDARRQQGLLRLYKSECTQGGCGRCPLS